MKKIVFATSNPNKIREVKALLGDKFEIVGLTDIGCHEEVPETQSTIVGNALQKARYVSKHYQVNCFSEDTGLEIEALNNEPGVDTAMYAGPQRNADDNMNLVLEKLQDQPNRNARFKTVIALIIDGKEQTFEGIVNGSIALQKMGTDGFGYDPIFLPTGEKRSFAEMTKAKKNEISHRGRAVRKLIDFLSQQE
ncbi:MAG: non-canonical purine NTP diphosphatase [Bacteroidota bacterium]